MNNYANTSGTKGESNIRTLICTVCNQSFEAKHSNNKYCSDECRNQGRKNRRKNWETETNYNEKQRINKMVQRQQKKELQTTEDLERIRLKNAEIKQRTDKRNEQRTNELKKKAKNGDPAARMRLAKPNSKEYWEAFRQYEIDQSKSFKNRTIRKVNDVSIFDEDFAEKVIKSIEVEGKIHSKLILNR